MSRTLSRPVVFAALVLTLACTSSGVQTEAAPPQEQTGSRGQALIDHVTPRRDFTGPAPTKFEWTAAAGADEYAIGVWNESDMMVWRQAGIPQPSVGLPAEIVLEPGTYYWSIVGLREGQPIAQSGLSAFVVMPSR
jgi:hypothetical protein